MLHKQLLGYQFVNFISYIYERTTNIGYQKFKSKLFFYFHKFFQNNLSFFVCV